MAESNSPSISILLLAGGRGTRFWPKSRDKFPKQMLDLMGSGRSMIEETLLRVKDLAPPNHIFLSTRSDIAGPLRDMTKLPLDQIIVEPVPKNTAPAIGAAAAIMHDRFGDHVMVVLPSDHNIYPVETFQRQLREAAKNAWEHHALVCLGIPPTRPATGYGYIQIGDPIDKDSFTVKRFVEKPNQTTAEAYIAEGNYVWNAGIFVWRASDILNAIETHLPDLGKELAIFRKYIGTPNETKALEDLFLNSEPISIDYGVMENHESVFVVRSAFEWDDLGSWESLTRYLPRKSENWSTAKQLLTLDSKDNIIYVSGKRVALLGVEDLLVVECDDTLLITKRKEAERVGQLTSLLSKKPT